jgi:hypothetical protein
MSLPRASAVRWKFTQDPELRPAGRREMAVLGEPRQKFISASPVEWAAL